MGKRYYNLLEKVASIENLRLADRKTRKGKRHTTQYLLFREHEEENLLQLREEILSGNYKRGDYYSFTVRDPKERVIYALPFRDRVVQQAIHIIIEPIFDKTFYNHSYSCRKGKGVHIGVINTQKFLRSEKKQFGKCFYLKMDFRKYFYSIDKAILFKELFKKVKDVSLLKIINKFDGFKGKGISVGNLLSQLFSNVYGNILDKFIKEKLKIKKYVRYADDTVIISHNKNYLRKIQKIIERFVSLFMKLKLSKWSIENEDAKPLNFLGYRISYEFLLLRKRSIVRSRRKIKFYIKTHHHKKLQTFLSSWKGHLMWASTYNLKQSLNKQYNAWTIQYQ
jgi:retron-type reverse transcriptase